MSQPRDLFILILNFVAEYNRIFLITLNKDISRKQKVINMDVVSNPWFVKTIDESRGERFDVFYFY